MRADEKYRLCVTCFRACEGYLQMNQASNQLRLFRSSSGAAPV
jgi:hypothetical protein